MIRGPPRSTLFPDPTLFRSGGWVAGADRAGIAGGALVVARAATRPRRVNTLAGRAVAAVGGAGVAVVAVAGVAAGGGGDAPPADRKSTRLNSSHANISYALF